MKKFKYTSKINSIAAALLVALMFGCEREWSDDISLQSIQTHQKFLQTFQ